MLSWSLPVPGGCSRFSGHTPAHTQTSLQCSRSVCSGWKHSHVTARLSPLPGSLPSFTHTAGHRHQEACHRSSLRLHRIRSSNHTLRCVLCPSRKPIPPTAMKRSGGSHLGPYERLCGQTPVPHLSVQEAPASAPGMTACVHVRSSHPLSVTPAPLVLPKLLPCHPFS